MEGEVEQLEEKEEGKKKERERGEVEEAGRRRGIGLEG